MANAADLVGVEEASRRLGVSVQHVRRLADSGALTKLGRGQIDRASLERYQAIHHQSRTRAWAEHTAWGAIAMLSGQDSDWLGATQASRLRRTLRDLNDPDELLTRVRDRAEVKTFVAHRAALQRLRSVVVRADLRGLGLVDLNEDRVDGYIATHALEAAVRPLGLRVDISGNVVLRATDFDFSRVEKILTQGQVVAALDAATAVDPRVRGVGQRALAEVLEAYR